jgi:catechol 2,3-dioxygenase-like lactoylglutathione lyase family enzyme
VASRAVPILASRDLATTLRFYETLGFENRGAPPPDEWDYLIAGRDGIELHFIGPSAGERAPGSCFLYVEDADGIHAEWKALAPPSAEVELPVITDYGMNEFTLVDPHGNEIRVGSPAS